MGSGHDDHRRATTGPADPERQARATDHRAIIAGAVGLAVLTGAGGFALGYAVSGNGAGQVAAGRGAGRVTGPAVDTR